MRVVPDVAVWLLSACGSCTLLCLRLCLRLQLRLQSVRALAPILTLASGHSAALISDSEKTMSANLPRVSVFDRC